MAILATLFAAIGRQAGRVLTTALGWALDDLAHLGWFADGQDLARFAMAYAIRRGVAPGSAENTETRWAIGNFDDTHEIRDVIAAVYPDNPTPVRLIEYLTNEGLRLISERVSTGERNLMAFLA